MYIVCTYECACIYTYTYTCICSTGCSDNLHEHRQREGPELKIQQELTEQLGCLWFHDVLLTYD